MKSVYIETSIPSYLTAIPSRDVRAAAWQELTVQWWEHARQHYDLYTPEIVVAEAGEGNPAAAERRIAALRAIPELPVDQEVESLAAKLVADGWNCRHINNADTKPLIRSICALAGYTCPEICTPQELLPEEDDNVSR